MAVGQAEQGRSLVKVMIDGQIQGGENNHDDVTRMSIRFARNDKVSDCM